MKIKIVLLSTLITIALYGCAQYGAIKSTIASAGADAADEALSVAIWQLCNASTYGAIKRKFAASREKAQAVRILCAEDVIGVNLILSIHNDE